MDYKEIVEAIEGQDTSLPVVEIYNANNTRVVRVDLPEKLIVRYSSGDETTIRLQSKLTESIDRGDGLTAKILYWEIREGNNQPQIIQIQQYLPGEPLAENPAPIESRAITHAVFKLHEGLVETTALFRSEQIMSINKVFPGLLAAAQDGPMKEAGARLMEDQRYREINDHQADCLIDGDLWPRNFLLERSDKGLFARIVDLDPILLGPPILQPAILFSSCFLPSHFMGSADEKAPFDLDALISYWPEPLDRQDILLMMQVFPIALSLQKELQYAQNPGQDSKALRESLNLHTKCLEFIRREPG